MSTNRHNQNQKKSDGPVIKTFGCRLNVYESEVMREHARNAGLNDVVIVNTCAVTKEAERQARQSIRRLRKKHPDSEIIVTGCSAQIDPERYAAMDGVSRVIGNDVKLKADTWGSESTEKIKVNDIMAVQETAGHLVSGFEGHSRAFVQVQNGCDHRCTFCIIPYGRGNSRSVPIGVIADQVRLLVESGYKEVVMTGVDVTSYGGDLPGKPTLGQMIRRVLALVPDLKRLRLSSLDPVEMDEDLWRLVAEEPRLMPHLHISLQAGDDMILKRMKRRHLRQDLIDFCDRARRYRPDIVFGADIIAGFPTETDAMFENTFNIVEDCGLTYLHVFPYSEREGTPAARMPQVDPVLRKERAARLREKGDDMIKRYYSSLRGRILPVLMEKDGAGRTEHFGEVSLDSNLQPGSIVMAEILGIENNVLKGHLVSH